MPTSLHSIPDLARFAAKAAPGDERILSKQGEVTTAGLLHRGHKYALLSQHLLHTEFKRFAQENIKTHLDLKEALKQAAPLEIALQAFSLLSPAAYRGEPLTREALLEVTTLLEELKLDSQSYAELKQRFDKVSQDPRLQACLELHYPGKMDGLFKALLHQAKETARTTGVNVTISMLLPGIGAMIAAGREFYQVAKACDREAHHHQVQQIGQLPGRGSRLGHISGDVLSKEHALIATKGATNATLGVALSGIGNFGVSGVATHGVAKIAAKALPMVASKALSSALPTAVNQGAAYLIGEEADDTLTDQRLSDVLPRLEVSNEMGAFSFSMLDKGSVRALLTYLGPAADPALLTPEAPANLREMEQARLALKGQLGSPPDEQLLPGRHEENAPTEALKLSHQAYQKLLDEDYHWLLPAVSVLDKGTGEDLNQKLAYRLPLQAENGTVYLEKSPRLSQEQLEALKETGAPSQLKLLYLAEGWL
ncbi:CesT family type III secretion system chaperone [Aeromonas schubertii]|uniref:CesT family type III secretion system chaperone n=1 Tax=Aeromonas schubertii TaxID=652 RepID=UPI0010A9390C|nr:CesT family type III secretion system chaperone [Aeromonas schubertii]QCG47565.1 CesT family type III secretion system chaperone [Aeromonas schubertii]